MGQFYSLLRDACGFWSLTNCGCGLQKKKKPHPAWVFLKKMLEKQLILFAWPNSMSCGSETLETVCTWLSCNSKLGLFDDDSLDPTDLHNHDQN